MGNSPSNRTSEKEDYDRFLHAYSPTSPSQEALAKLYERGSSNSTKEILEKKLTKKKGKSTREEKALSKLLPADFKGLKHKQKINKVVIDPDFSTNKTIWSCSHDKTICSWDAQTGKCLKVFQGHTKPVTCMFIDNLSSISSSSSSSATTTTSSSSSSAKTKFLFSGSFDRTVRCWDISTGICKRVYNENENWVTCLYVHNNLLFCAGYDCVINIYDVETCKKLKTLRGHTKRIDDMHMDQNGVLYTASLDCTVRSWDVDTGKSLKIYSLRDHCLSISTFPQQNLLLCAQSQEIQLFDIEDEEAFAPYVGLSHFTLYEDYLIAWNRPLQQFEFWNLITNVMVHVIKDKDILNASNLSIVEVVVPKVPEKGAKSETQRLRSDNDGDEESDTTSSMAHDKIIVLYFSVGNAIQAKKITLPFEAEDLDEEELKVYLAKQAEIASPSTTKAKSIISSSPSLFQRQSPPASPVLTASKSPVPNQLHYQHSLLQKPTYMLYPKLFNYYSEVLMYPSSLIAAVVDDLHAKEILQGCKNFDGQIDKVAEAIAERLKITHNASVNNSKSPQQSSASVLDFEIMVYPFKSPSQQQNQNSLNAELHMAVSQLEKSTLDQIRKSQLIYTEDEYGLDFETRLEIFYQRIRTYYTKSASPAPSGTSEASSASTSFGGEGSNSSSTTTQQDQRPSAAPQQQYEAMMLQPTVIVVRRDQLVFDACKHFSILNQEDLRKQMYIFFAGEQGLDMGGVTREFYQLLSEQILDPNNALFLQCGSKTYTYYPNPASLINEAHLQYFLFIGKLIGKAIFDMQVMDTHFSPALFKLIVGSPLTIQDLEHVDPSMFMSLKKILMTSATSNESTNVNKMIIPTSMQVRSDFNVEDLDITFSAEVNDFGSNNVYNLVENGENTRVTEANKYQFVSLYAKWKLVESVRPQLERLLCGIYELIPRPFFSIFNEKELELLLCGSPDIDVEEWKRYTKYEGGFSEQNPAILMFWEMVNDMNVIQRSKLLQFATGSSSLPHEGFDGLFPNFTICKLHHVSLDYLPHSHTCLNRVDFPAYESKEVMKKRFEQAIEHGLYGFYDF